MTFDTPEKQTLLFGTETFVCKSAVYQILVLPTACVCVYVYCMYIYVYIYCMHACMQYLTS